jgi:cyclic pyranopterin phosphate synthase
MIPATAPELPRDRLGRPLHDLRVSVIETCNYRCPYCMPEGLTPDETALDRARRLDFDEIETAVRAFARLGVSKLRLTGGEPLLRKGLPELIARLARVPGIDDLALTTTGSLLADVLAGLAAAEAAGFRSIKINCVIQRGVNEDQAIALAGRFRGTPHVPRFIEYMDVGTCNGWRRENVVSSAELRDRIAARWPLRALTPTYRGEVASRYGYADGEGEVGCVSSVSEPFCGDCHRARLSADGQLFTCLFAARGQALRERIAEGEDALAAHLAGLWRARGDRYSEERALVSPERKKIEMFYIGG